VNDEVPHYRKPLKLGGDKSKKNTSWVNLNKKKAWYINFGNKDPLQVIDEINEPFLDLLYILILMTKEDFLKEYGKDANPLSIEKDRIDPDILQDFIKRREAKSDEEAEPKSTKHHRRPRYLFKEVKKERRHNNNISKKRCAKKHSAWHCIFDVKDVPEIADDLNTIWLDPEYIVIPVKL